MKVPHVIHAKAPHIKSCNAVGFVVKCAAQPDMPFFKLSEALEYCEMMGLPDDADHLILDPANARLLAVPLLHHAEYEIKLLEKQWEKIRADLTTLRERRDKLEAKRFKGILDQVQIEGLDEKIQENIGRVGGMYEALKVLDDRRMELWNITQLGAKPNWW